MKLLEALAAIPMFEGLNPGQHRALASIAREQGHESGEIIFSDGDEANGLYVVKEGRVKIYKLSPDGKEQILHLFGPGEPFGEVAVFVGRRFPAYAEALEKTRTIFFPRAALIDLIRANPDLALSLLGVLSLRLRRFANLIEDLSLKEVPSRLAAYLLYLSDREGGNDLELDITKGQLASLLGTIPETLSRILTRMGRRGLISTSGRRIKLLNRRELEDLASAEARLE
ncbi:MAG: Crp/Fnr family transcriptional regulator [Thermodesulfobacteriota bacterium]